MEKQEPRQDHRGCEGNADCNVIEDLRDKTDALNVQAQTGTGDF